MKINKITQTDLGIEVEVEGFPHAQPVFEAGLSEAELQVKVDAWAVWHSASSAKVREYASVFSLAKVA